PDRARGLIRFWFCTDRGLGRMRSSHLQCPERGWSGLLSKHRTWSSHDVFRPVCKGSAGTPDPNWDFEPDALTVKKGTTINAVNQGGEPHTFNYAVSRSFTRPGRLSAFP